MVPSFRTWVELTLEGEKVKIRTNGEDHINAERALGGSIMEHAMELQFRTDFTALRRQFPEHPAAKNFRTFMEMIDGREELDPVDPDDSLDPTRPAASDD